MSPKKRALVTGITGQDGSYLAEFLLFKNYDVHGIVRPASSFNRARIDHLYQDPHLPDTRFFLHYGDLSDSEQLTDMIYNIKPDDYTTGELKVMSDLVLIFQSILKRCGLCCSRASRMTMLLVKPILSKNWLNLLQN